MLPEWGHGGVRAQAEKSFAERKLGQHVSWSLVDQIFEIDKIKCQPSLKKTYFQSISRQSENISEAFGDRSPHIYHDDILCHPSVPL